MARARIDRIALVVPDLSAAATELEELFDIHLHVHDVPAMGARVGMCDEGFELVQPLEQAPGAPTLAAIGLRVDDLEDARKRMAERGYEPSSEVQSPGDLRELFYTNGPAGIPLALAEYRDDGFATASNAHLEGPFEPRWVSRASADGQE
jgi:hypothetical protein